jgi:hypothetical protein
MEIASLLAEWPATHYPWPLGVRVRSFLTAKGIEDVVQVSNHRHLHFRAFPIGQRRGLLTVNAVITIANPTVFILRRLCSTFDFRCIPSFLPSFVDFSIILAPAYHLPSITTATNAHFPTMSLTTLLIVFGVLLIVTFISQYRQRETLPDVPWLNRNPNAWFSKFRARVQTIFNSKDALDEAYKVTYPEFHDWNPDLSTVLEKIRSMYLSQYVQGHHHATGKYN